MKNNWRIALAQLSCEEGNKEYNLVKIEQAIEEAYSQKADLLVLPEMFLTGFLPKSRLIELSESRQGESMKRIQTKLAKYPMHLVYTFPEFVSEDIVYNTSCLIHLNGTPIEYYRKVHLFDDERYCVNRSNEWIDVKIDNVRIGILTCYDLEFPEAARVLALKGIDLLVAPSANMSPYEHRHRIFITSRALENHIFVAYCNRVGLNSRYEYHGQSAVISPNGDVLLDIGNDQEAVKVVEINISDVEKSKSVFNYIKERRPELYS